VTTGADNFMLAGRVAIVTGCNTGLGQGMALALAQAGADIVGVNVSAPDDTREQRIVALGRRFLDLRANLSDIGCIAEGLIKQALTLTGRIHILVNNAGIIRREDAINFTEKDWDDVLDLNLKSVFFFAQAAARQFIEQGSGGKIINVASMLSFQGGVRVPSTPPARAA
jgi:2-deoxy-D-gluconate 3-dehydrogenase